MWECDLQGLCKATGWIFRTEVVLTSYQLTGRKMSEKVATHVIYRHNRTTIVLSH